MLLQCCFSLIHANALLYAASFEKDNGTSTHLPSLLTLTGHTQCVNDLLAAGADPIMRNHAGRTPLVEAKLTRNTHTIELLEARWVGCDD